MIARCLAFDPGPKSSGWAVLQSGSGNARPTFIEGGNVPSRGTELAALIGGHAHHAAAGHLPFVVAIEWIAGYVHQHARGAALIETARVEQYIATLAGGMAVRVVQVSASTWRQRLCGKGNASDALVKRAVTTMVARLPARTNKHVRDAMGAAFVVLQDQALSRLAKERTGT